MRNDGGKLTRDRVQVAMKREFPEKKMNNIEGICKKFIQEHIILATPFGDGHVNDTFRVETEDGSGYVCQRIRKAMDIAALEHNYLLYAQAFEAAGWSYPVWLRTKDGKRFFTDQEGDHWRMYPMIEGEVLALPLSENALFSCGQGLARMHLILQALPGTPRAVYPMLHDLKHYYDRFCGLFENGTFDEEQRDMELEEEIHSRLEEMLSLTLDKTRLIHGDPKLANILFQEGKVKAFIDLDTVMQGSLLEDLADCIRSCCAKDGKMDQTLAQSLLRGYRSVAGELLSEKEMELLPKVIRKICFELGLRYYTDSIAEKKSFREKYPGYLREKAHGYFAMARD